MVIEIKKSTNPEYKDTLKMSALAPFEYAIVSKIDFEEPLTGESQYGEWAKFNVKVHSYKTFDPATGETKVETPEQECGLFASAKTLRAGLDPVALDEPVKIRQEAVEGKAYKVYIVEPANGSQAPATSAKADKNEEPAPATEKVYPNSDAMIKALKAEGMALEMIKLKVVAKYTDLTPEFVEFRYGAL